MTAPHGDPSGSAGHDDLASYLLGALNGLSAEAAEEHLARCPACARELEHLVWISGLLAEAAAALGDPFPAGSRREDPAPAEPPRAHVGRAPGAGPTSPGIRVPARVRAGRVHPVRCH